MITKWYGLVSIVAYVLCQDIAQMCRFVRVGALKPDIPAPINVH